MSSAKHISPSNPKPHINHTCPSAHCNPMALTI